MPLSALPLSYCTNVHPGQSIAEVEAGLDRYTVNLQKNFGAPLAAGLWLADPVVQELLGAPHRVRQFADGLLRRGLTCHTLNAFPFGNFHSARVKENVYLPDWSSPLRLAYTRQCAAILSELLPPGVDEGSISTVPLGFKGFAHDPAFFDLCIDALINLAQFLDQLKSRTGNMVRLAIEPEPACCLETTAETIAFFERLFQRSQERGVGEIARQFLGVCYDVCHQAVEFENIGQSIAALTAAEIRINKVHISCALELQDPAANADGRHALRYYVEPRYLHQTIARDKSGGTHQQIDLDLALIEKPPAYFATADAWRVHFHVPVDADHIGPLHTTRPALREALRAVSELNYAPHLEVETYTWAVLPGAGKIELVEGLTRELQAARSMIEQTQPKELK